MVKDYYMRRAILQALKGKGKASPNPLVGAVIVKNGKIIGEGFHEKYGGPHAEVRAIDNAIEPVKGSTLYSTLEPCCHEGKKTPPCTKRIIAEGFKKVIIGSIDPNAKVNGKGIIELNEAGIETEIGILEDDCAKLIESYAYYIRKRMPYIAIKAAQSLDGRIATSAGDSRWITDEKARIRAHELRAKYDAVMVGTSTCLKDNPQLTVRHVDGRNPFRVIIDMDLKVPIDYNIYNNNDPEKTIILSGEKSSGEKYNELLDKGIKIINIPKLENNRFDLKVGLSVLSERFNISSILVEGGADLITEIVRLRFVNKFYWFVAAKFIGKGIAAIGDLNIEKMADTLELDIESIEKINDQVLFTGKILYK